MQDKCHVLVHVFTILSLLIPVGLSGCSSAPTTAPEKPLQGITLQVAGPDFTEELLRPAVLAWQSRNGATVTFQPLDPQTGPARPADVWLIPTWQLPHWIAEKKLSPLPESLPRTDGTNPWPGLLPIYRESLVVWQGPQGRMGTPYAIPVVGEAPLLCYRTDLYNDSAHRQAYRTATNQELTPPTTWAEFTSQATYWKKAGFPLPALPDDPVSLERRFGQVAAGYVRRPIHDTGSNQGPPKEISLALFHDPESGDPRLEHPGFVHALRLLQAMQSCRAPAGKDAPEESFLLGQAPLCICDSPWVVQFQSNRSKVRDRFGILPLPGAEKYFGPDAGPTGEQEFRTPNRMPYLGCTSWVAVLPTDAATPEAATSLLAHLLNREVSTALMLTPQHAGQAVRGEQLEDSVAWDVLGLDLERTRAAKTALRDTLAPRTLRNPALCLRLPQTEQLREALVQQLRRGLLEGADAKACLTEAAQQWRDLAKQIGPERMRANVRLSIGLTP